MTAADWFTAIAAAIAAVGTVGAAIAAAISAKASSDTARILKAEHDAERARMRLGPFLEIQELLEEFLAQVVERNEGTPVANHLHRRIRTIVEYGELRDVALRETRKVRRPGDRTRRAGAQGTRRDRSGYPEKRSPLGPSVESVRVTARAKRWRREKPWR
jgi:hypothetical protein